MNTMEEKKENFQDFNFETFLCKKKKNAVKLGSTDYQPYHSHYKYTIVAMKATALRAEKYFRYAQVKSAHMLTFNITDMMASSRHSRHSHRKIRFERRKKKCDTYGTFESV